MQVINKDNNELYEVYNVSYDKAGYPHFLIYKNNQWCRVSAKHFRPLAVIDLYDVDSDTGDLKVL